MDMQEENRMSWFERKKMEYREDFRATFLSVPPKKVALNLTLIFLGSVILAFATSFFLVPMKIVMGGNSGIALVLMKIIEEATNNTQPTWLDTDFLITMLTIFFFILAFILLGFSSLFKNTISALTYPSFVYIFTAIRNIPNFHYLRIEEYASDFENSVIGTNYDPLAVCLVAGIFGGIFIGLAYSVAFMGGGTAGGTTCLVIFFSRHTKLKANTVSIIIDSIVIFIGLLTYKNIVTCLIGIMTAIICSQMISRIFVGGQQGLHAQVVSPKWKEISEKIHTNMRRGTTIYTAQGGYTGAERKVIYVSFTKEDYQQFLEIVQSEDPKAFITITQIYEVSGGYGFKVKKLSKRNRKKKKDVIMLDSPRKIEENSEKKESEEN